MGFGFNMFLVPNSISPSGFSGLAAIISTFLAKININVNPSIFYLILNVILYIFAFKLLGKRFAIFALVGILSFSVSIELTSLIPWQFTEDLFVSALYGGIIFGIGTGFVLRNNGSTGGTDMLAVIIKNRTQKLKTGQLILVCNIFVLALSILAYGAHSLLYSIIALFLSSETTDIVIDGAKGVRAYYIITNKKEEVSAKIFSEIKRGATEIKSTGMYSHQDKSMILCVINKYRAPLLRRIVFDIDPQAFVFSTSVNEVLGKGFFVPTPKKDKNKKEKSNNVDTIEIEETKDQKSTSAKTNDTTNLVDITNEVSSIKDESENSTQQSRDTKENNVDQTITTYSIKEENVVDTAQKQKSKKKKSDK